MKLSSDASALRLTHEGIANFTSLCDFYKKIMQNLPRIHNTSIYVIGAGATRSIAAEAAVTRASVYSISDSRLITAINATK